MRTLSILAMGVLVGFGLSVAGLANTVAQRLATLPQMRMIDRTITPAECAEQVNTEGWQTFNDKTFGIVLLYPPSYVLSQDTKGESITLTLRGSVDGVGSIVLTKLRGDVRSQMQEEMQLAGWKIADRSVFALSGPYVNTSEHNLNEVQSTYLFVRDFPKELYQNTIVKAVITDSLSSPEFKSKKAVKEGSMEGELTTPEQILSTFRFLTYHEIYGPAGYQPSR